MAVCVSRIFDLAAGQSCVVGCPWVGLPGCIPVLARKPKCSAHLAQPSCSGHTSSCWASFRRITLGLCYKNKNPTLPASPPPKPWVALLQAFSYVKATNLPSLSACQDSGIRPNVFTLKVMSTCRRSDSVFITCKHTIALISYRPTSGKKYILDQLLPWLYPLIHLS